MSRLALLLSILLQDPSPPPAERTGSLADLDAVIELLDLREAPLEDALRMLSEESGVNLIASESASKKPVSAFLQGMSIRDAIEAIALSNGLWYRIDEESRLVRIMSNEEFQRDLKEFRDQRTTVFTLLFPNAFDIAAALRNLYGDRVRMSLDRDLLYDQYEELSQRLRRFDLFDERTQGQGVFGNQSTILSGQSFQNGQQNFGLLSSLSPDSGWDRGRPERASDAPLEDLGAAQIRALDELARSGEDPGALDQMEGEEPTIFVTVMRRTNTLVVRSADSAAMDDIERLVKTLDVPTPQVLLEVKILNLDLGDDFSSAFNFLFSDGKSAASFTQGLIDTDADAEDPNAFLFRFVDEHFRARIELLEQDNRVTTLATPLLLVANNEVARLFVGEERPLVRAVSSQTIVTESSTTTAPTNTIEIRPVGTTLLLTPNVNADRTVTLRVLQETSQVREGAATIPVILSNGTVEQQPIDVVATRNLTGTVVAKDGLTLAIGGLIEEDVGSLRSGVPLLMDLPILGALFRRETKTRSHRELLLLIRPYVLFTSAEGTAISRQLTEELSRHPVGFDGRTLGTYGKDEVPRPPLGKNPLRDALRFQSGLPDGQ